MGQIIAKYGAKKGTKIDYKDDLTWLEFAGITKLSANSSDSMAANNSLIKIAVTKVTEVGGVEHTNAVEILNFINTLNARDGVRLVKALTELVQDDDDNDPKASGQD